MAHCKVWCVDWMAFSRDVKVLLSLKLITKVLCAAMCVFMLQNQIEGTIYSTVTKLTLHNLISEQAQKVFFFICD